ATLPLRGAKKMAELLRSQAAQARMSRDLATIRCDVPLEVNAAELHYEGPDHAALRVLFNQLDFQTLLKNLPATAAPAPVAVERLESPEEVARVVEEVHSAGRFSLACAGPGAPMSGTSEGVLLAAGENVHFVSAEVATRGDVAGLFGDPGLLKIGY